MRLDETQRETISTRQSNNGSVSVKQNKVITIKNKNNMYKHFDEPLFDYIIIRETGKFSSEGYKTVYLFGVNYEDESKKKFLVVIQTVLKLVLLVDLTSIKTEVYLCSVRLSRSQTALVRYLLLIPILDRLLQLKIVINLL